MKKSRNRAAEKIGENIRYYRLRNDFTQTELAEMLEIGRVTLTNYEAGQQDITYVLLLRIAVLLKVSVADLVEGVKPEDG